MKRSPNTITRSVLFVLAAGMFAPFTVGTGKAQLYASDSASVKGGDLLDRDYWRARWNSIPLDEAIAERQPEGPILMAVIGQSQLLDQLIQKYPNDQDFKTWKAHTEEIKAKIDPNANRREEFKPGSLWAENDYKEAYVNYNYAKLAIGKKDWAAAHDGLNYAEKNLGFLLDRIKKNDRVSAWPDGAAQWVQDAAAEVARMNTQVNARLR